MALGLTIADWGATFIKYLPDFIQLYHVPKSLLNQISLRSRMWTGEELRKKILYQENTGVGYTEAGGPIPASGTPRYTEAKYGRRFLVASARVTDDAIATSKNGGAVRDAVKDIMRSTSDTISLLEDFLLCRDGTGVVALLGATVSGAFITVNDARMMVPDGHYEIRAAATGTLVTSFSVASKRTSVQAAGDFRVDLTGTLAASGQAAGDFIVWGQGDTSTYGRAISGFQRLINDSLVGTFQNVTLASFPAFTSFIMSNGGAVQNVTFGLTRRMLAALAQRRGLGQVANMLVWMDAWTNVNWEELGQGEIRIQPTELMAGRIVQTFQSVFGKFSVMNHAMAVYGEMAFLDRSAVELLKQQELDWRPASDSGGIFQRDNTNLSYVASMLGIYEMGIHERHWCGRITNLANSPLISY